VTTGFSACNIDRVRRRSFSRKSKRGQAKIRGSGERCGRRYGAGRGVCNLGGPIFASTEMTDDSRAI
jgi:hypothetical protein